MTTTTAPATRTGHRVFFELLPEYFGGETLPACPDGSGDLWWDDASYARYQAWDGPTYRPEQIDREATTDDYCDGKPPAYVAFLDGRQLCACHRAEWERQHAWTDAPF